MEFLKKYKPFLLMGVCALVILACCLYIMLDTASDEGGDDLGGGDVVGEYDISANGDGSIKATLYKDGLLDIRGSGVMKELKNIPWLDHYRTIKKVKISEGITTVGDYAFYHCTLLSEVELPKGITYIGAHAFDGTVLASVALPNSVTEVGECAFDSTQIKELTVPASVKTMGYRAFQNCEALEKLTLENGVSMIGDGAFFGCKSLKNVTVPESVTYIGSNAFYGCDKLETVTFDKTVGWFVTKDKGATSGDMMSVLTSTENAANLRDIKAAYFWKKAE